MNKLVSALFSEVQDIEGIQKQMGGMIEKVKDNTEQIA